MKKTLKILFIFLIIITLCGCNNKKSNKLEEEENPIEEKKVTIVDLESNTRPYAVMINCHDAALPQSGLDNAYLVYEIMVEGGITRMMALFKDVDVEKIGSTRSARAQYLPYVMENDAIYAHAGGSAEAISLINSDDRLNDINVDGVYGMRDKSLDRAWEHTLFTSTDLLKSATEKYGYRTTTDKGVLLNYSADELDLSQYDDSIKVNDLSIVYSNYRTSNYKYDEDEKKYLRSMNDTENIDLVTGKQYQVKNIIAYDVEYTTYEDHGYYGYQKLSNIGSGEGYYISNGYAIPITWQKDSDEEKTIYKLKSTGEELVVNDGNTYIQIYPKSGSISLN